MDSILSNLKIRTIQPYKFYEIKTLLFRFLSLKRSVFISYILFTALFHGSFHKTVEEGVGPVRAALEFRMGLGGGKVGMIF